MNFCDFVVASAAQHPERRALHIPASGSRSPENLTYAELLTQAAGLQARFRALGLTKGSQVLLLARPSASLYSVVLALLGEGMVPVLIDPGMGIKRVAASLAQSTIAAVAGEASLLRWCWLFRRLRNLPRLVLEESVSISSTADAFQSRPLDELATGLITFTSGSTGKPKGANRTHASLIAQHLAIRANWKDQDDDVDSPCFPVLVLHNLCCGIETVMPACDLSRPGEANGSAILAQFAAEGVTRIACAPAYLKQLVDAARLEGRTLPQVRSLMVGGSTLTRDLLRYALEIFPAAELKSVYGSTEAEPVAKVFLTELDEHWDTGEGFLAGIPVPEVDVQIVAPDRPLTSEAEVLAALQPTGASGEILVAGTHVLQGYINNPEADIANKIPRASGGVWHRTGDAGYLDDAGRLWLLGRIKDRVTGCGREGYTWTLEKQIDALPGVRRSALISTDDGPLLVLEGQPLDFPSLLSLLEAQGMPQVKIAHVPRMPVDGRHNSKVDRPTLLQWQKKGLLPDSALLQRKENRLQITPGSSSHFIVRLSAVDWLTLSAVLTTALAMYYAWHGALYAAVGWLFMAMLADGLDGPLARRSGLLRPFGRYLDGFMDMLIYLVAPSLVYIQHGLNPLWLLPVLAAGSVRLSVFNDIGNPVGRNGTAYLGLPVFWSQFLLGAYLLLDLILPSFFMGWLWGTVLLTFSYAMVRNRIFPKIHGLGNILKLSLGGSLLFFLLQWWS